MLLDTACGIKYLHDNKIIHMNIQPSNVLMGVDGLPRICDFGRAIDELINGCRVYFDEPKNLFLAPEYGKKVSDKLDIYSFGVLMFIVLSEEEYDDENEFISCFIDDAKNGEIHGISCKELCDLILECLNEEPNKRPSMGYIIEKLNSISELLSGFE